MKPVIREFWLPIAVLFIALSAAPAIAVLIAMWVDGKLG